MRPTALFDAAERLLLARGTRHPKEQVLWHRLVELTIYWKGYDDGSALVTVQKTDLRTGDGFRTLLGGAVSDSGTYLVTAYQPGPWERQLTSAAASAGGLRTADPLRPQQSGIEQ